MNWRIKLPRRGGSVMMVVLMLLYCIGSVAQQSDYCCNFSVKTLATQSQLPVANIYTVFQDSEGFMWYGTIGGGLCRDNGYQVHVFSPSECAQNSQADNILSIAEDGRGNIWCVTDVGLFCLDCRTMRFTQPYRFEESLSTIAKGSDGRLWIGASNAIYALSADGEQCSKVYSAPGGWNMNQFFEDSHQCLFALFSDGIACWDAATSTFLPVETHQNLNAMFMAQDTDNDYWVATWDTGVVHLDLSTGQVTTQPLTTADADIARCMSLVIDHNHSLMWVTSFAGLQVYRICGNKLEPFDTGNFLPLRRCILGVAYEDGSGNVWIPGFVPNTFIISASKHEMQRIRLNEMLDTTGYPLLADRVVSRAGSLWIHQGRIGLMHYDKRTHKLEMAGGNQYGNIICRDKNGSGVLAVRGNHLDRVHYANAIEYATLCSLPDPITSILDDGNSTIYIGTAKAVFAYSQVSERERRLCKTAVPVTALCLRGSELYYIVEGKGVYCLSPHGDSSPRLVAASAFFSALAVGQDGTLWTVGTDGNVFRSQGDTLLIDKEMSPYPKEPLTDVACDRRGHIWTLSNQRAREYNPDTHSFRTITNTAPEVDVSYFFLFEEAEGDSVGIGAAGAYLVVPSSQELDLVSSAAHAPRVTTFLLGDSIVHAQRDMQQIDIPWEQSTIGCQLSTLDAMNAASISFAYRVEELDTDWVYLPQGVNTFYINNLPYGDYHLSLRATDVSGCWQNKEGGILLRHFRPWWQTWWARCLFLLLLAIPLYSLYATGVRVRKMKQLHEQRRELALTEIAAPSQQELLEAKDKEFLAAARDCVERNIADSQFNVEALASDLCLSRSALYRRLQSLTDMSPVEFVRDIRLKHAAQMLSDAPNATMADVAKSVGFASSSYFTKCFKEHFGVLPTQWSSCNKPT